MIKSIIIDDEQYCIDALKTDIDKYCGNVEVSATCTSAKEGIFAIKKYKPRLIFLDVEMPWMNGFEMLELLDHIDFCIIFTTAHDKFAARAFRISAVDYLLKPVDINDLKTAIKKAEEKILASEGAINIENLLHNIKQPSQRQKIAFPQRDGYEFIPAENILYCHAEGAYTTVHLTGNKKLLVSRALGDIEEMLPEDVFQRIHHSIIVNVHHITNLIRSDGGYVMIDNGEKLIISKSKKDILLQRLGLKRD
ncbi:LytR/AlgR family response regulator transcription factor [Parafilimonas terrae]|uniref:Two component transcriptional regulator, LytTR family n=1 Tax=Parafilimonas terrae TaxID=1465490 RepID=A0A1I5S1L5_9BACT|nr:LytTR family DNA-binding domain-containing protein [Parafilimonas terrae]SFP64698.1 two component transcriptional regulator, LytTR family [Parafilimonas terrae]